MAVIDILTPYDAKKKAAHAAKTVKHGVRVQYVKHSTSTKFVLSLLKICTSFFSPGRGRDLNS